MAIQEKRPIDPNFMLIVAHPSCGTSFLVPENRLGQIIRCPCDGCKIRLPPAPLRETVGLRRFGEADWAGTHDPEILLTFAVTWMSRRKQRLFAAACCRTAWELLDDRRSQEAVQAADDYADCMIRTGLLSAAAIAAEAAVPPWPQGCRTSHSEHGRWYAATAASGVATLHIEPCMVARLIRIALAYSRDSYPEDEPERAAQASLVRELVGNPFRRVVVNWAALNWRDRTIPDLAQVIYDRRALPNGILDEGGLAMLADNLEESGCTDADVMTHLREPGRHVRGCWVLDAILGRE